MNSLTNWFVIGIVIGSVISLSYHIAEVRTDVRMMNERIEHLERGINRPISIEDISTTNGYYHVIVGRDPLDNMPMLGMPMLGMDENGAICPL